MGTPKLSIELHSMQFRHGSERVAGVSQLQQPSVLLEGTDYVLEVFHRIHLKGGETWPTYPRL